MIVQSSLLSGFRFTASAQKWYQLLVRGKTFMENWFYNTIHDLWGNNNDGMLKMT